MFGYTNDDYYYEDYGYEDEEDLEGYADDRFFDDAVDFAYNVLSQTHLDPRGYFFSFFDEDDEVAQEAWKYANT